MLETPGRECMFGGKRKLLTAEYYEKRSIIFGKLTSMPSNTGRMQCVVTLGEIKKGSFVFIVDICI